MAVEVYTSVQLEAVTCGECGVIFGMTTDYYKKRHEDHKTWYCPNGHGRAYLAESKAEKYKRMLEAERTRLQWERDQREATERSLAATKGQVTKLKKRASAGVCPCCNRQFQNVKLHMSKKHPEEVKAHGIALEKHPAEVIGTR